MKCAVCGADTAGEGGLCPKCDSRQTASHETGPPPASTRSTSLAFAPGEPFGPRYTIVEEVGSGGMGRVYKAIDRELGRTVALKLVRPDLAAHAAIRERFRRELLLAQQVSHPNVCRVHDLGEEQGIHYISMEFVEGQTLSDLIGSVGMLSPRQAVALGRQICAGLQAVHDRGIVHRDLKPGNIMLDRSGRALVMDFGMAYNPEVDRITAEGSVLGTLAYLSPEQARGEALGPGSDLYSLGLILFEMLAGKRPPGDGMALPLALRESGAACPPPSRFGSGIPPALDAPVLRCLEREPSRRFGSAAELGQALEAVANGLSTGSPLTPPPAVRPRRRGRRWVPVIAAVAVVVATLGLWARQALRRAPPERPVVAVLPLSLVGGDAGDEYIGVGIADTLVTRLAGLPSVTVVSRDSTLEYRGRAVKARAVARELGVNYVVQGGVQHRGEKLRVTLNLVRPDDSVAWGRDYESGLDDVFALQGRLAEDLSGALQVALTGAERQRLARPPTTNAAAYAEYGQARALLERPDVAGNVSRAIALFEAAVQKDPRFALAHAGRGEACWQQYQETREVSWTGCAERSIHEALRLDPSEARTRLALALVYRGTGRAEAAVDELDKAIALAPASDDAHRVRGEVLAERGEGEEAIRELRNAIALRPGYWRHHASLGNAYYRIGSYPEAIAAFRRVTELQPDNSRGFQMLGTAYQAAGDNRHAYENYERAIALGPDARAYTNLGTLLYREGRLPEAVKAWEESARLEPTHVKQRNLGDAYARLGQPEKARAAYERAVELSEAALLVNAKDARTLGALAVYEAKLGRRRSAGEHARQAIALAPKDGEVLYRQAVVHALAGEKESALHALEKALGHGYSASFAREDEDLDSIRATSAFRTMVARPR